MGHLDQVALTWAQRAQAELGAEKRFKSLAKDLAALGARPAIIELAHAACADEARHARACSEMARSLGHASGFATFEDAPAELQKTWVGRENPADILLCEVVLMCCITETVNASLLNTLYHGSETGSAAASASRKLVHEILKDEVKHGQIGWAHLQAESERRSCGFLSRYLPRMLEIAVKDELFVPANADDTDAFAYGVLPMALRLEQFECTLNQVVFPGFEKFGVDTRDAKEWFAVKASLTP